MMQLFKDRLRSSHVLTALFFLGVLVSVYFLFRIPSTLYLTDGFARLATPYIIIAITFVLGIVALVFALEYKKELIVMRDRTVSSRDEAESNQSSQAASFNIGLLHTALKGITATHDIFHHGLQTIGKVLQAGQGAIYQIVKKHEQTTANFVDGYAFALEEGKTIHFDLGDGLIGQVAADGKIMHIDEVPEGYINIISGLGSSSPRYLLIVPIKQENEVLGIFELASFSPFDSARQKFAEQAAQVLAEKLSSKK